MLLHVLHHVELEKPSVATNIARKVALLQMYSLYVLFQIKFARNLNPALVTHFFRVSVVSSGVIPVLLACDKNFRAAFDGASVCCFNFGVVQIGVALEGSLCRESFLAKRAFQNIPRLVHLALVTVKLVVRIKFFSACRTFDKLWVKFEVDEFMFLEALSTDRDTITFIASKPTARFLVVVLLHLKSSTLWIGH